MDDISKHIAALQELGKTPNLIWQEIYRKAKDRGPEIAELNEMTFAQGDYVSLYLGAWIDNIKTERAKKNGGKK